MLSTQEILVLSLISDQPSHGYELRQQIDTGYLSHCARISTPQIYSVLRRLAERELVSAKEEREGNAPPRTVYKIEQKGREALSELIRDQPNSRENTLFEFDMILSAMAHVEGLGTAQSLSVVAQRIRMVESQLVKCRKVSQSVDSGDRLPGLAQAVYDHRTRHLKSEMQWLKNLENMIREKGWESFVRQRKGTNKRESTKL